MRIRSLIAATLAAGALLTGTGMALQAADRQPAYAATHHRMGRHALMGAIVRGQSIEIDGVTYRAYRVPGSGRLTASLRAGHGPARGVAARTRAPASYDNSREDGHGNGDHGEACGRVPRGGLQGAVAHDRGR
jgi:hypothetical protein